MSDAKPSTPKADALAKQLKMQLAQRRPRPWKLVLATLVASVLVLGLIAWWMYPRPPLPPLQIMALDILCSADETPEVKALVFAPPGDNESRRLSGHTVIFHEQALLLAAGARPRELIVKTDERGQASAEWPIAPATSAEYLVLYRDETERRGSPHERGQIFVWPKDAPLMIVDADETLITNELDPQIAETLAKADKEGWRIVYLSVAGAKAYEFRKVRGWIEKQAKLPAGPVLGRPFPGEATIDEARRASLKSLRDRFQGDALAIVKHAESAEVCKALGIRTVMIGGAAAPADVVHVLTWADVPVKRK